MTYSSFQATKVINYNDYTFQLHLGLILFSVICFVSFL